MSDITPRHLAVLALLDAEPYIEPNEVAHRLGVSLLDVEALFRELAAEGLFGSD